MVIKFKKSQLKNYIYALMIVSAIFVGSYLSVSSQADSTDNILVKDYVKSKVYFVNGVNYNLNNSCDRKNNIVKNMTEQLVLKQKEIYALNENITSLQNQIYDLDREKTCVPMNWEGRSGVAFGSKYYCVWTENVMPDVIGASEEHEKCHVLVAKQYSHFIGGDNNSSTYIFVK